jgi:hypothetical protein
MAQLKDLIVNGSARILNTLYVSTLSATTLSATDVNTTNVTATKTTSTNVYSNLLSLQGTTTSSNAFDSTNPKIQFLNSSGDQGCQLVFTDYDAIQAPASLTLVGQSGEEAVYFIAPNIKATSAFYGGTITAGKTTLSSDLEFSQSGTTTRGIIGYIGGNDYWRVVGGATASNAGFLEIATADDANEPIYVRQYTGKFTTLKRTLTLLDGSGNTTLPGGLTTGGNINASSNNVYAKVFINPSSEFCSAISLKNNGDLLANFSNDLYIFRSNSLNSDGSKIKINSDLCCYNYSPSQEAGHQTAFKTAIESSSDDTNYSNYLKNAYTDASVSWQISSAGNATFNSIYFDELKNDNIIVNNDVHFFLQNGCFYIGDENDNERFEVNKGDISIYGDVYISRTLTATKGITIGSSNKVSNTETQTTVTGIYSGTAAISSVSLSSGQIYMKYS